MKCFSPFVYVIRTKFSKNDHMLFFSSFIHLESTKCIDKKTFQFIKNFIIVHPDKMLAHTRKIKISMTFFCKKKLVHWFWEEEREMRNDKVSSCLVLCLILNAQTSMGKCINFCLQCLTEKQETLFHHHKTNDSKQTKLSHIA